MARLNSCVVDIRAWMASSFLKLNDDKTELILLGNPKTSVDDTQFPVTRAESTVMPPACARYIEVYFDGTLSCKTFINKTAACVVYHIRSLAATRDHLPREPTGHLCTSQVISQLDYCNSELTGLRSAHCGLCNLP